MDDTLQKTATPIPYIETILPGRNKIKGWVGIIKDNKILPEKSAYIYVYINGFLINPPETLPNGGYKNIKTAILSKEDGSWETSTFFFDVFPSFEYGAVITFKAKAPLKDMSEPSIPYAIGATPTPIELGVYDSLGKKRNPYDGETSIMGRMSYWFRQEPDINGQKGYPQFNCDTKVYVYLDGIHEGSSKESGIGEIYKNEIRGTSAIFPIYGNINNQVLPLKVGSNQLNVPFSELSPFDQPVLEGLKNGSNKEYIFTLEDSNVGFRIFKNGQRLTEGKDYIHQVLHDTLESKSLVKIIFYVPPYEVDDIVLVLQHNITSVILHEHPIGPKDEVNQTFTLQQVPYSGSLEIFKNGLKLNPLSPSPDYSLHGNTITLTFPLSSQDIFIADYQPILPGSSQLIYSSEIMGSISEESSTNRNTNFIVSIPDKPGNIHIYKNGLKLKKGSIPNEDGSAEIYGDYYTNNIGNVITFTGLGIPSSKDVLNASFYSSPITLQQIVNYLNNTPEFADNCLTASIRSTQTIKNYFIPAQPKNEINSIFSIPLTGVPVDVRLYKNGRRLTKITNDFPNGDYIVNYNNAEITFVIPPSATDKILGLFSYKLSDFIIEKKLKPTNDPYKFELDFIPKQKSVSIYMNGIRLNPLSSPPLYTIENNLIIFSFIPPVNAVLLVDYEVAYGINDLIETIIPSGNIDGVNTTFSYPPQLNGTALNVFKNGFLQIPEEDYIVTNSAITFMAEKTPNQNDSLFIETNKGTLFTDNPKNQLKISSPYPIELVTYQENSYIQNLLFGDNIELWPGKGEDGEFMFWFDRRTGYWKWTSYNPFTNKTTPFKKGQHITARAWNNSLIKYKV